MQRDGKLRADIGSHSRLVSGLALHPSRDVVASVAEDGTLAVWSLPLGGNKVGREGGREGNRNGNRMEWVSGLGFRAHTARVGRVARRQSGGGRDAAAPFLYKISAANMSFRAQPECLLSVCWLHAMLTGVAFCGPSADDVAVVAYDTDELHVYKY